MLNIPVVAVNPDDEDIDHGLNKSLAKIEALFSNAQVMGAISGRMPSLYDGEESDEKDDEKTYQERIAKTLEVWNKNYDSNTWEVKF